MKYIGVNEDGKKLILLRSWGGADLVSFMKSHAKVKFEETPADGDTAAVPADSYDAAITKIKAELRKMVNRTMAMYQLFTTKQGDRNWMDYIKTLEDKAHVLDFAAVPYTENDAIKDAAIFGMSDEKMQEKALAEDPTLDKLIRWGQSREAGREGAHRLKDNRSQVSRVGTRDLSMEEIDGQIQSLMRLKKQGRYSGRPIRQKNEEKKSEERKQTPTTCNTCSAKHIPGECRAQGKKCFTCGGRDHFSGSRACEGSRESSNSVNRVSGSASKASYSHTMMADGKQWPGVNSEETRELRQITSVNKVSNEEDKTSKHVKVTVGDKPIDMYADTGSGYSIIPPTAYESSMGEVIPADTHLRAWGSETNLDVKGMVKTTITTAKGAQITTHVYIVDGFHPEPLLGDADAERLGFISFNPEGREPEPKEVHRIAQKIRSNLHVKVETVGTVEESIPTNEKQRVQKLIDRFKGLVFSEKKIGKVQMKPIHLEVEPDYIPPQPQFHNTPIHYQKQLSEHLQFLREQKAITDIDPSESHTYDCVMNTVITDKKDGQIRMNLDTTPWNPGMKRTKFHVQTPQEIRHELKEAKIFTEMDMGWAYHQLPIDEETKERSVFQSHEGLHRMEVLYFGPKASSGIFHNAVRKKLGGLSRARNIYDNIIVWGTDFDDHYANLEACLDRCAREGIVLKTSKTHTCLNKIKWFGRTFTSQGVTVDQDKINAIVDEGRPENTEDVRSFLMACQYNAKFLFDSQEVQETYEEVTAPLRSLLKRDVKFVWGADQETAYSKLLTLMESPATLRPYRLGLPTHYVADSSEVGIQASIYQVEEGGTWVPVDHISRSLTKTEAGYSPIERESLAQCWGMDLFRFYLVGGEYTAWTDHQPLVSIYNQRGKKTSKRIASHRDEVCDLQYTMKHLAGNAMPCDYGSRHPFPISHMSEEQQEKLGCDTGKMIYVRKIDVSNSPDAILPAQIIQCALKDATYQRIQEEVKGGFGPTKKIPVAYRRVWSELCVIDGILHKGDKMVLPNSQVDEGGGGSIRDRALDIAHEGHIGASETKQFLRAKVWFPGMDDKVNQLVSTCLPCLAATETKHRDPLIPTEPPATPWTNLAADHWGPTPDGKHLLLVIDELTRYPELEVVSGTSVDANIEAFDTMFCRHGYPETLKTDGGPPFNGTDSHLLKQYFRWAGIKHHPTISADDPEANGLAEAAMKHCKKIWHTAIVEKKNPYAEINKHLLKMRTTPHPTTKKSPAELMFNRHIRTRLPQTTTLIGERTDIEEARDEDRRMKLKQKKYKDNKRYVKPHQIKVGDQVLLKQKQTKRHPPFDPDPYIVTGVHGHQITASRGRQQMTRDAQKWKKVVIRAPTDYNNIRQEERRRELRDSQVDILDMDAPGDDDLQREAPATEEGVHEAREEDPQPPVQHRYPTRERSRPDRFGEWASE